MDIPGTHVFSRSRLIVVALALTVAAVVAALAVRPELAAGTASPDQPGLAGAGVAGFGTTNPPNTEIIFPRKKIVTKRRVAKVRFSYGCVTDDSLGENTCDFFECTLDGGGWRRCPGGASDPGADEEVTYRIKATQSWRTLRLRSQGHRHRREDRSHPGGLALHGQALRSHRRVQRCLELKGQGRREQGARTLLRIWKSTNG